MGPEYEYLVVSEAARAKTTCAAFRFFERRYIYAQSKAEGECGQD